MTNDCLSHRLLPLKVLLLRDLWIQIIYAVTANQSRSGSYPIWRHQQPKCDRTIETVTLLDLYLGATIRYQYPTLLIYSWSHISNHHLRSRRGSSQAKRKQIDIILFKSSELDLPVMFLKNGFNRPNSIWPARSPKKAFIGVPTRKRHDR